MKNSRVYDFAAKAASFDASRKLAYLWQNDVFVVVVLRDTFVQTNALFGKLNWRRAL